ncbi:MAG: hypothetical protein Q4E36_02895 [Bacillota bacterium]|nr:hypothetical protein [Bacillota bacterium]
MKKLLILAMALVLLTACGKDQPGLNKEETAKETVLENPDQDQGYQGDFIALEDADIQKFGDTVRAYVLNPKEYGIIPYYISLNKLYLSSENSQGIDGFLEEYNEVRREPLTVEDLGSDLMDLALIEYTIEAESEEDLKKVYENKSFSFKVSYDEESSINSVFTVPFANIKEIDGKTIFVRELFNIERNRKDYSFVTTLDSDQGRSKEVYFRDL